MTDKECYFCDRLAGPSPDPRVYEDDLLHVSHAVNESGPRSYLGQLVIQTRRHTEHGLPDLTDAEGERIGWAVARASRGLRSVVGAAWTYTYCYTEGFRHVHQFVVARYPQMPPEAARLQAMDWTGAPEGTTKEVAGLVAKLAPFFDRSRVGSAREVPQ